MRLLLIPLVAGLLLLGATVPGPAAASDPYPVQVPLPDPVPAPLPTPPVPPAPIPVETPAPGPILGPIDAYAPYQATKGCRRTARPGTTVLATWLWARGGRPGPLTRACRGSGSDHEDGRAIDWMLDVRVPAERRLARDFIREIRAGDEAGNKHALARRMGIMYVIWDDRIWASYRGFKPRRYHSSSCRTKRKCSRTLRHRDHVHISLSKAGARGRTSWYAAR